MATTGVETVDCKLVSVGTLELEDDHPEPYYRSLVVLSDNMLMVIDSMTDTLRLHSRHDGKLIASRNKMMWPQDVCVVGKGEVVVWLLHGQIEILSVESTGQAAAIMQSKTLSVRNIFTHCHGVRALRYMDKLVVSGRNEDSICLGLVSLLDGHVDHVHTVCKYEHLSYSYTYLATSPNDSLVYISCWAGHDSTINGVYAFDFIESRMKIIYHHRDLNCPSGISVDRRGFVYVCNMAPSCIHQLTERLQLVRIHKEGIPEGPLAMHWVDQLEEFYVTSQWNKKVWILYNVWSNKQGSYIPLEIMNMDNKSIQLFKEALKDGTERIYNIRVMVVGHSGVGKTTLVKRLLGKDVNISERRITEGIDVHVHCCDVSQTTGEWTQRKGSEQGYQLQRLARLLNKQQSVKDKVSTKAQAVIIPQGNVPDSTAIIRDEQQVMIPPQGKRSLDIHKGSRVFVEEDRELLYIRSQHQELGGSLPSTASKQMTYPSALVQMMPTYTEKNTLAMLKLLQENADKLEIDTGNNSPLSVWDFAGHHALYTTHQAFLTRRAIYLLVSDVSSHVTDLVNDDYCLLDAERITNCRVYELIEVWLNTIHTCAPYPEASIPPVILVGTHVDKISQKAAKRTESKAQTKMSETAEFTLPTLSTPTATFTVEQPRASTFLEYMWNVFKPQAKKRKVEMTPVSRMTGAHAIPAVDEPRTQKTFSFGDRMGKKIEDADTEKTDCQKISERHFREIRYYLRDKPSRFHLVDEDFAIDNTIIDSKLEDLKRKIVKVASQQPYWGEEIPKRWILLEQELMRFKAAGVKVIPRSLLEDLNRKSAVQIATDELDLFLRFMHDIGTILYFSMEVLKEKIVLDPQWIIDALKSLITAEMFVMRSSPAVAEKWFLFKENGKLTQELIDAIWTKEKNRDLHDNKNHLLLLMEHLNIIARPRCYSQDGSEIKMEKYFLAPFMLRKTTPTEVIFPGPHPGIGSSSVLCYIFVQKFLPIPIFNRLLATCVAHWPIAKYRSDNLIFCGSCVFDIDIQHRLTMFFKGYAIFVRISGIGVAKDTPSSKPGIEVREFITRALDNIIGSMGLSLRYELCIQCPQCYGFSVDCLLPVADFKENVEVPCHFHDWGHVIRSQDVLKFWFQDEEQFDDGSSAGPMPLPSTSETTNFMRITYLLVDIGSRILRHLFHHHTVTHLNNLDQYLANKRNTINSLLKKKVLNIAQMDILFPPNGSMTNLDDYDITLLSALLINIVPSLSHQEMKMIQTLREDRNLLYSHAKSCKMNNHDFQTCWNSISSTLITLSQQCGDSNFQNQILQEIQSTKVSAVPAGSFLDLLKTWFGRVETLTSRLDALELKKPAD